MFARPRETGPGILEGRQCRHNATAYPRRYRRGSGRGPSVSQLSPRYAHDRVLTFANTSTIKALLDCFTRYIAGDESAIPVDLLNITFSTVSSYSLTPLKANIPNFISTLGCEAHRCTGVRCGTQAVREFQNAVDKGSSYVRPSLLPYLSHLADYDVLTSRGLTNSVDPALQARTFDLMLSSVRNQDLVYFFRGLSTNTAALNALREFFEANYHSVGAPSMCSG